MKSGEIVLIGAHITPLPTASTHVHADPTRTRKLLLHREEINRLIGKVERAGYTLAPLNLHYKSGRIKLEIGLAKGKKQHDKRETIKEREWNREQQRLLRNRTGTRAESVAGRPMASGSQREFERGLAAQPRQLRAADAGRVPRAQRARSSRDKVAVRHGRLAYTYREFEARCRRLASALARARRRARRHRRGDGAQRAGAARSALRRARARRRAESRSTSASTRATIAFCLEHGGAKVLITDAEFAPVDQGGARADARPDRSSSTSTTPEGPAGERLGAFATRTLLAEGDPAFAWPGPRDEWDSLALLYTSGTTGDPKGVVYHHRGAYLNALGNALAFRLAAGQRLPVDAADVPLQRLDVHVGGDRRRRHARVPAPRRSRADLRARFATTASRTCAARRSCCNLLIHAPGRSRRRASTTSSTSPPAAPRRRRR